ncbi:Arm DNA-binding domain-containing protein, partial [Roseateles saccharophilus]
MLGRHPEITLRTARELALRDRAQIQQGVDVAVVGGGQETLLFGGETAVLAMTRHYGAPQVSIR